MQLWLCCSFHFCLYVCRTSNAYVCICIQNIHLDKYALITQNLFFFLFCMYFFLFYEQEKLCLVYLQDIAKMFCCCTKNLYARLSVEGRWIASQHMATASKPSFKKKQPKYPTGDFGLDKNERRTLRKRLLEVRISCCFVVHVVKGT